MSLQQQCGERQRTVRHNLSVLQRALLRALTAALVSLVTLLASQAQAADPDIVMWGHPACPHCKTAHGFLKDLQVRRPDIKIVEHDVTRSPETYQELRARAEQAGHDMVGLPSFVVRGRFLVGFDSAKTTGAQIEAIVASTRRPVVAQRGPPRDQKSKPLPPQASQETGVQTEAPLASSESPRVAQHGPAHTPGSETPRVPHSGAPSSEGTVELPVFGHVSVKKLGLPIFTIAIGLVDGFNPCAMWVLLFLLSLLVNIKSRARMLAIAGCFVFVSGLAYYAFMAAWLNVFMLVGISRVVQVVIGAVALVVGVVNVKDFFAFEKGVSFSIPERAKPGIYARVRSIVRAESLGAAMLGATVLAVLVNIVELVCTAGLPALYTQVLVQQGVSPGQRYGYLALYIVAYMFDDSIMVGIAVITLGKRKLQEKAGRWLKLLSGVVILLLGLLLIFAPEMLLW